MTTEQTIAFRQASLYRRSPASTTLALPAGTYVIHEHDSDGETELENAQTGETWDPNSVYPWAGRWRKDGEHVGYEALRNGDVADLMESLYLTTEDASL